MSPTLSPTSTAWSPALCNRKAVLCIPAEKVPVAGVLSLKACGNYTEMACLDGRTLLHHQRLGQIMEDPPDQFLRVHRSHALNLACTLGLHSVEGSRYYARLQGGSEAPVSRYQVSEVRAFLKK